MKKVYILLLAVLLVLAGCSGRVKAEDVSVQDVCCPYDITHKKSALQVSLHSGELTDITWSVQAIPQDVCEISEPTAKGGTSRYTITGIEEGAAQLTFSAQQSNGTDVFALIMVIGVDGDHRVTLSSSRHSERDDTTVETDGLNYTWSVDLSGVLTFSFVNSEDSWSVRGDGEGVCTLSSKMSTPAGCKFSAAAKSAGTTDVLLVGESTNRRITVTVQVDDTGKISVASVQEQ